MVDIFRYRVEWATGPGGPGVSTFHFGDGTNTTGAYAESAAAILAGMFGDLANYLPDDVTLTFPSEAELVDDATGQLVGVVSIADPPDPVTGSSSTGFAGGVGARITWNTAAILRGRRVKGTTFLAPLDQGVYDSSGQIAPVIATAIQTAAGGAVVAMAAADVPLLVWSRPTDTAAGEANLVTGASVPARVAWLRTRKV